MPVKQEGDLFTVDGEEFKTEEAANSAYQAKLALMMGVDPPKKEKKKSKKKE